jgi:hypothetical protein
MTPKSTRRSRRLAHIATPLVLIACTTSAAFAQSAVDQSNPAAAFTCLNAGTYTMSQGFTPTFDRLNFAEIHLTGGSGPAVNGDFSLRLLQNGNLVRESAHVTIPAVSGTSGYFRFPFPDEAFLSPGQQYQLQLVNHSATSYFRWCQSQNDAYAGGSPTVTPSGGGAGDFLFRTGMQSVFGPPQAQTYGDGYSLFESALKPLTPVTSGSSISVSSGFFSGMNFEITQPTRLSRIGAYFTNSGSVFGAVFRTDGFTGVPNPANLSGSDVVATTLINVPTGGGDASGTVDVTLTPGWYGVLFGSGKFGATSSNGLRDLPESNGFWLPYSVRQSDGQRFFQSGEFRVFAEAKSAPGTAQARPAFDTQAEKFANQWILTDGDTSIVGDRFDFFGTDRRALMEFDLGDVPSGASVTSVTLRLTPNQLTSGGGGGPRLFFHGYAGNGTASAADAAVPLNEIGATPVVTTFDPFEVTLSPTYVQSLLNQGATHLGLMIRGDDNGHRVHFLTWEDGSPDTVPLLTINFKLQGDYDANGIVDAADFGVWRQNYGTTNAAADGNGNGVVDAADYVLWRKKTTSTPASGAFADAASVPEPPATMLLIAAALVVPLARPAEKRRILNNFC